MKMGGEGGRAGRDGIEHFVAFGEHEGCEEVLRRARLSNLIDELKDIQGSFEAELSYKIG